MKACIIALMTLAVSGSALAGEIKTTCSSSDQRLFYRESRSAGGMRTLEVIETTFDGLAIEDRFDRQASGGFEDDENEISNTAGSHTSNGNEIPPSRIYTVSFVVSRFPNTDDPEDAPVKELYRDVVICKEVGRACGMCP